MTNQTPTATSAMKTTLNQATKEAMKARDKRRVATLRMVKAELQRIEVDERRELSGESPESDVVDEPIASQLRRSPRGLSLGSSTSVFRERTRW